VRDATNYGCGLVFYRFNGIREGGIVEVYVMEEIYTRDGLSCHVRRGTAITMSVISILRFIQEEMNPNAKEK